MRMLPSVCADTTSHRASPDAKGVGKQAHLPTGSGHLAQSSTVSQVLHCLREQGSVWGWATAASESQSSVGPDLFRVGSGLMKQPRCLKTFKICDIIINAFSFFWSFFLFFFLIFCFFIFEKTALLRNNSILNHSPI